MSRQSILFIDRWNVADETNENRMKRQSVYMDGLKTNIKEKCQETPVIRWSCMILCRIIW